MRYEIINRECKAWPIRLMCKVFNVSESGFYGWRKRPKEADLIRLQLQSEVRQIATAHKNRYGSRRMSAELRAKGFDVGRRMAISLMREVGIEVRYMRKKRKTTDSKHGLPVFKNLLDRDFKPERPNQVWASDITYIRTFEGWLYLNVVVDLYSRKIVGWSIRDNMEKEIVIDALKMAYNIRQPGRGLIHHSDRGSQYASNDFKDMLITYGMIGSMSRKGDCWDNACVESFFGSLKCEQVYWTKYLTRDEARLDIVGYLMYYNSTRMHSYCGNPSPNAFEASEKAVLVAAA